MTGTETWVLVGVVFFLTGFGGIIIYRDCLPKFQSGRNVLRRLVRRHGDIELQDVDHIQSNLRDIDLDISSLPEYPSSQAIINHTPIRWNGNTNFRYSEISGISVPRYSQITENTVPGYSVSGNSVPRYSDFYINSTFENNINLKIIFFIFIVIVILTIIWKIRNNSRITYLKMIIQIKILWILISIFIMNYLIPHNSIGEMAILFPFSLFQIDFRDSFDWQYKSYREKSKISYLMLQTLTQDIQILLNSLKDEVNYSMSLSFISSYKEWKDNKENAPPLLISEAIIINKESDPILISQFIMEQLDNKGYFITHWISKDDSINLIDSKILTATVPIYIEI